MDEGDEKNALKTGGGTNARVRAMTLPPPLSQQRLKHDVQKPLDRKNQVASKSIMLQTLNCISKMTEGSLMAKKAVEFKSETQFRKFFEKNLDKFGVKSIKLSQKVTPDYVCIMKDGSVKNVEAELDARHFLQHSHDERKVDLIVCAVSSVDRIHGIPVTALDYRPSEVVIVASSEPRWAEETFWEENCWKWIAVDESQFPEYLALYVKKPVGAIDRFAKIDDKRTKIREDGKYRFEFEWKTKLGHPIKGGQRIRGIQGRWYVTLKSFLSARTLDDLKEE